MEYNGNLFYIIREKADAALNNALLFQLRHAAAPRCHRNARSDGSRLCSSSNRDMEGLTELKLTSSYIKKVSPCRLSHYPVLPVSIGINWGVHPPTSIESTSLIKMTLRRIQGYGVLT